MQKYLLIGATLLLTVVGQLVIKWRALEIGRIAEQPGKAAYLLAMLTDSLVWCGLAAAVLASVCWILVVQQAAVSVAYPFMALSFLLVPAAAALLFGEAVSAGQYLGLALIVLGVALTAVLR
jgi:multidrug transporter EmrE-like cation transporter